jgi:5-methylcytosine-specific restriction endonuclease McrA
MEQQAIDFNPGQRLYKYLQSILPGSVAVSGNTSEHFVSKSDRILNLSGSFIAMSYDSCVIHLLRRLITGATWVKRKCDRFEHGQAEFIRDLRNFVSTRYLLPSADVEFVCVLLFECVRASEAKVSSGFSRQMLRDVMAKECRCYICGCVLTLTENDRAHAEIEHVWPRSLGGSSSPENLRLACFDCNKKKKDYIDASDYHFERMCCTVIDRSDASFGRALYADFRLAVLAKTDYCCSVCGQGPLDVGSLKFVRRNRDDAWHLLNVDAVCDKHDSELTS